MRRTKKQRGFSLVELLTVVSILGVLSSIAIGNYQLYQKRARASVVGYDLKVFKDSILAHYSSEGSMPESSVVGHVPPGMTETMPFKFAAKSTFGQDYQWLKVSSSEGQITLTQGFIDNDALRIVDAIIDDGSLLTGNFVNLSGIVLTVDALR